MASPTFTRDLLAPRYWLTWLGVAILWLFAHLPWFIQYRLGAGIGYLFYRLAKMRVDDTRINLALCFPEKSEAEREAMVCDVFRNAGIGIFETLKAWFYDSRYFHDKTEFEGDEHFKRALSKGNGVILIGAHYSTLDLLATLAVPHVNADLVYRPQRNPVIEYIMVHGRLKLHRKMISHKDTRSLIRSVKENRVIWYPIDQDYGRQQAVFVPFFGTPAATLTTASRLSRINQASVVFIGAYRLGDRQRYRVTFTPALENFPSNDDVADTKRINIELEKLIRMAPTQYMWFHRRFKTRPEGEPEPYAMKKKWKKRLNLK